ncbi:hypothetical protein [Gloeothece verrucosa]|uniref:Uncharacterized protein n=1 Tax=Gloeothece verrucosa (strain PCC 7822) TaxID=497965 RepID=E0UNU4_GLOV7|nr:hypothetical protein [Gloeothece verrucosa]ADN18624.1 hypothetical protein Cyan7822_6675 [Gloeothece verrucosa PCC 7822]
MLSNVRVIASAVKEGKSLPLLLYDDDIARQWQENTENILIYKRKTLASLSPEELEDLKNNREVIVVEKNDLFLDELYFIYLDEALPGGLLPETKNNDSIIFNDRRVTPLIPLNQILLDYFTPEDLVSKIKFQMLKGEENKVRLTLNLPLSGIQSDKSNENPKVYSLSKDYTLFEKNLLTDQLPVLEVWPNFQAQGWKEYYGFYYDAELGESTFQVSFPNARYTHSFKQGMGTYQMVHLESFPECIHCLDGDKTIIGLILLKSPETVELKKKWKVGVDFEALFTNVYVNDKGVAEALKMEDLLYQVTESNSETRLTVLFEYFIPQAFLPKEKPLPLPTVLTMNGKNPQNEKLLPILDGRIYVPDSSRFDPKEEWVKTDLKWSVNNLPYIEVFLKHLALHITALAAYSGVREIEWFLSYPSPLSRRYKRLYVSLWQDLTTELEKTTGIIQKSPDFNFNNLRSDSLAFAQYFRDFEEYDLVYTTCVYLLDRTADIGIWEDNQLIHQTTISLGEKDLFRDFLRSNLKFVEQKFKLDPLDRRRWKDLTREAFERKLNVWIRWESHHWLKSERILLQDDPDLQGLVRLTSIGLAGLYYYVGIILEVLGREGKYKRNKITPVYLGGRGSHILNWLDNRGVFNKNSEINELFSRMLSAGSGFEDTEELTRLSRHLGDEVACGLVLNDTRLSQIENNINEGLIAGEDFLLKVFNNRENQENTKRISRESRLKLEEGEEVIDFKIPELVQLPKFLYEFHKALRDLDIEEITPLKGYVRSPERDKNKKLWDETQRHLESYLLNKKEHFSREPPFILGLKALLQVLGQEWVESGTYDEEQSR